MNQKLLFVFIIAVFILGGLFYVYYPEPVEYTIPDKNNNEPEPVFCTADAKLCPDGSYVSRTGPDCEFVCPGEKPPTEQ